jgi:tetratricopeptide (TPR) repeat protein
LGIEAAEALDHAHQNGVLHRDIKPANLLVDNAGKLWITDFGLARMEADAGITMSGDLLGTLRYMSPEQALAKRVVVDHRSDIYSLGATLYELLTLEPAFGETDRAELLKRIAFDEPRAPRMVNSGVPIDLETIVLKALEKDASDRYATALELGNDLRRFVEDQPIKARPGTTLQRLAKWSRRHVAAVWSTATILFISTAVLIVASLQVVKWYREAEVQRVLASAQLKESQKQERTAKAVADLLLDMLASANPDSTRGKEYTVRQMLDYFSGRFDGQLNDVPEVKATLHATMGKAYRRLNAPEQAESHLKSALKLRRHVLGPRHVAVADSLLDYAWHLNDVAVNKAGNSDAIPYIEEAIAIYRCNDTPAEPMLNALWTLHQTLAWSHRFDEAEVVGEEGLQIASELETIDSPSLANLLHSIGGRRLFQGRHAEAEALLRKAVKIHRKLRGEFYPETGWTLSRLGLALEAQGKLKESESAQRQALAIFRHHYGPTHSVFSEITPRLAFVLAEIGDRSALTVLDAALESADNNSRPVMLFQSALFQLALDDHEAYRRTCSKMFSEFGSDAHGASVFLTSWACALAPAALEDLDPLIEMARTAAANDPTRDSLQVLGALLYRSGDCVQAIAKLEEATKYEHEPSSRTLNTYIPFYLAMAHHRLGHHDQAREYLLGGIKAAQADLQAACTPPMFLRLTLQLLRSEAEDLLGTTKPATPKTDTMTMIQLNDESETVAI